jgi:integrase
MKARSVRKATVISDLARRDSPERDWFLRDSAWDDVVWIFAPTNVLEEERPHRIRWDFTLPSGRRFTDAQYASLLQSARQLLSLLRTRSLQSGLAQRSSTVAKYFLHLRALVQWMDAEGFCRFSDLDSAALLRFQSAIARRKKNTGATVAPITVQQHLCLLVCLYHFRNEIDDGLSVDPCPGQRAYAFVGVRRSGRHKWPYTPDAIAIPLIQGAVELLENCAIDILRAREIYATTMADVQRRGRCYSTCTRVAERALRQVMTLTPRGPQTIHSAAELDELLHMLYSACFVVISYLVGPRASEVLQLRTGCLQSRAVHGTSGEAGLAMIVGAIFKNEADYHGRPHEWVAPQAAVHAISVLEALSASHRLQTGRNQLWLRALGQTRTRGATEWQIGFAGPFRIPTTPCIAYGLDRFATWLGVPHYEGKRWHLSTHQGRKTFARFAALRDRSALFALAQHMGHRDRAITDQGYVGTDYALDREIDAEVLEQSVSAWEHMLSAPELGGRAGSEILTKRPRFRGVRMKQDLKSYARMLVEAGLVLGVCDYGYCVYRQEYSACLGNASGPNPARREPSTCARCKNFAVSAQHRPYWLEQVHRHEALLNEPALPTQTLKIARERLSEALAMIRSIDSTSKDKGHGNRTKNEGHGR